MLYLNLSGNNLSLKAIEGSDNEKADKEKIAREIKGKIPIYKLDNFICWEVPKSNLTRIYELWDKSEILVDRKAQPLIDQHFFDSIPLKELMTEDIEVFPVDEDFIYNDCQEEFASIDHKKTALALFLETGSGKTACLLSRVANVGFSKVIILTILDNFSDWESHCRIMFGDSKKVVVYDGVAAKRKKIDLNLADIVISNYEKLKELKDKEFDAVIYDECQNCNNPDTKTFKLAKALISNKCVTQKYLASATPYEDDIKPIWGSLHMLNPRVAGSKEDFLNTYQEILTFMDKKYYVGGVQRTKRIVLKTRIKNLPKFQKLLSTIMYRKDVSHNFKFEDRTKIISVEITRKQQNLYDQIVNDIIEELHNKTFYNDNPLTKTLRLLQACDGYYNFDITNHESGKLNYIKSQLDKIPEKCVIWTRFKPLTTILGSLYPNGIVYNGDVTKKAKRFGKLAFQGCRDATEEEEFFKLLEDYPDSPFKKPGEANFLFSTISRNSGGMNLNICPRQIIACLGESGRNFKQASARIKRFDSTFEVIDTEILVTSGTIEPEHITKTLNKIKKASNLLDGIGSVMDTKIREIIDLIRVRS